MSATVALGGIKSRKAANSVRRSPLCAPAVGAKTAALGRSRRRTIGDLRRASAAQTRRRRSALGAGQLCVEEPVHGQCGAAPAEGELQTPAGADQARGQIRQLLHDGAQASALGLSPRRVVGAEQSDLPYPAQKIVGELRAGQDQGVGGEFAQGQALDVEVGLQLAVELLGGDVIGIEGDDLVARLPQARPPALQLDLRHQELLAELTDGALGDAHDAAQPVVIAAMSAVEVHVEDAHALAGTRLAPIGMRFGFGKPLLRAFRARVPFDDVLRRRALAVLLVVRGDQGDVLDAVVAAVHAQQQSALGQGARPRQDALQQRRGGALRVLLALQGPPLLSEVGGHGREAIVTRIGVGDALLARAAVVQRRGVQVARRHAVGQGSHRCAHVGQERKRRVDDHTAVDICMGIHAQARYPLRGNLLHAQRLVKEDVFAKAGYPFETRLAQPQQRDVAGDHVAMRHGVAAQCRDGRGVIRKTLMAIQRLTNEPEPDKGGEIHLQFSNDELTQRPTCRVIREMTVFYRYATVSDTVSRATTPPSSRIQVVLN